MLILAAACLILLPALLGYGLVLIRAVAGAGALQSDPARFAIAGFLGLMAVSAASTTTNFFVPISPVCQFAIMLPGLVFCGYFRREFGLWFNRAGLAALAAGIVLMAYLAWRPLLQYDDGLYHLQAIAWIEQSRIPLGLANLHARFGYNSSWDVLAAVIRIPGLPYSGAHVLNPLVALLFASASVLALKSALTSKNPTASDLFLALVAMPLGCRVISSPDLASASNDPPAALLTMLSLFLLMRGLDQRRAPNGDLRLALLISTLALTVKLSTAPLFLGVLLALMFRERHSVAPPLICVGSLALWAIRGIMLSGCLVFPVRWTRIGAWDWAVPAAELIKESEWIRSWARRPGLPPREVLGNWDWLGPWVARFVTWETALLGILILSGIVLGFVSRPRRTTARDADQIQRVPIAISFVGIGFWFFSAPDLRFGYGYLYSVALLVFAAGLEGALGIHAWRAALQRIGWAATVALWLATIYYSATAHTLGGPGPPRLKAAAFFALPPLPEAELLVTQINGLKFRHPAARDQCWVADLPCAPFIPRGLRFTRAGDSLPSMFWIEEPAIHAPGTQTEQTP